LHTFSTVIINQPSDITVCEGEEIMLICILNTTTVTNDDVMWYIFRSDTSYFGPIRPNNRINYYSVVNETTDYTVLSIHGVTIALNGFFWVKTHSNFTACNTSLIVIEGT